MDIDKLKTVLEKLIDKEILEALRTEPGEEWKISKETMEKVRAMIEKAEADAEESAQKEKVTSLSLLPDDVISSIFSVQSLDESECSFKLYGFKPMIGGGAEHYYKNSKIYTSGSDALLADLHRRGMPGGKATIRIFKSLLSGRFNQNLL